MGMMGLPIFAVVLGFLHSLRKYFLVSTFFSESIGSHVPCSSFPCKQSTPHIFLNSGVCVGYAGVIRSVLSQVLRVPATVHEGNDQFAMAMVYLRLRRRVPPVMVLDSGVRLSLTMFRTPRYCDEQELGSRQTGALANCVSS